MSRRRVDWGILGGFLFSFAVGSLFFGFGVWQTWTTWAFLGDAEERTVVVLDPGESCDDEGCTWWPTVSVAQPDGGSVILRSQFGSSDYRTSEGEEITVLYNAAYGHIRMPGTDDLWLLGAAGIFFGALALAIAVVTIRSGGVFTSAKRPDA